MKTHTNDIANDFAMIGLVYETMIVLLVNLSLDHADRHDQCGLHHGRLPYHFRWLKVILSCSSVNLVVHRSKVFVQFEVLHEPISGSNGSRFLMQLRTRSPTCHSSRIVCWDTNHTVLASILAKNGSSGSRTRSSCRTGRNRIQSVVASR